MTKAQLIKAISNVPDETQIKLRTDEITLLDIEKVSVIKDDFAPPPRNENVTAVVLIA
jgi:hypothetical protein|tara:strand:+ start:4318 stop:4491 length:174 start_codon:yes stop_codon:yes gene_type:complete